MKSSLQRTVLAFAFVVLVPLCFAADQNRRDGNWWIEQTRPNKIAYTVGFFDGMDLGNKFSYWGMDEKTRGSTITPILKSYSENVDKFLMNVTNYQLVDGLDAFYADYKNRRIVVHAAVWLVLNGIAGTPQAKLDKMIESWRRNSDRD